MSEATSASSYRSVDPFSVHRVTMHKHKGDETEAVISRKPELMVPSDAISAIDDEDDDESEVGITVTAPSRRSSGQSSLDKSRQVLRSLSRAFKTAERVHENINRSNHSQLFPDGTM